MKTVGNSLNKLAAEARIMQFIFINTMIRMMQWCLKDEIYSKAKTKDEMKLNCFEKIISTMMTNTYELEISSENRCFADAQEDLCKLKWTMKEQIYTKERNHERIQTLMEKTRKDKILQTADWRGRIY